MVVLSWMAGFLTDRRADIPPRDGLPTPLRYWAVSAIGLGVTMAALDGAIADVAPLSYWG